MTTDPHEVEVQVLDEGDRIHEETHGINSTDEYVDGVVVGDSTLPSDPGHFSLKAKVGGREWEEWYLPDYSTDSISVLLRTDGNPPTIRFSYSTDEDC